MCVYSLSTIENAQNPPPPPPPLPSVTHLWQCVCVSLLPVPSFSFSVVLKRSKHRTVCIRWCIQSAFKAYICRAYIYSCNRWSVAYATHTHISCPLYAFKSRTHTNCRTRTTRHETYAINETDSYAFKTHGHSERANVYAIVATSLISSFVIS